MVDSILWMLTCIQRTKGFICPLPYISKEPWNICLCSRFLYSNFFSFQPPGKPLKSFIIPHELYIHSLISGYFFFFTQSGWPGISLEILPTGSSFPHHYLSRSPMSGTIIQSLSLLFAYIYQADLFTNQDWSFSSFIGVLEGFSHAT